MKFLLTGKNGQVGWELARTLAPLGEVTAVGRAEMDLSSPDSMRKVIREIKPDLIVNAAAYTAVDKAESVPEMAMRINGIAPCIMAKEAKRLGAAIIHYSTDYVFDGTKKLPYTEEDVPNPINVYGKTKLAGDIAVQHADVPYLILRTSWIYGTRGHNFLLTMLRLTQENREICVVDDQIGAPTWSRDIAEATSHLVKQLMLCTPSRCQNETPASCSELSPVLGESGCNAALAIETIRLNSGIYNLSAVGETSWYGFAAAIFDTLKSSVTGNALSLRRITTSDYSSAARRPANSVLQGAKLAQVLGRRRPHWRELLANAFQEFEPKLRTFSQLQDAT